jgi:nucleoside-diphosphate-sugar epimerase
MRVLLTGGFGCIGSWIIRNLLARGDTVFVYDLHEDRRRLRLLVDEEAGPVVYLPGDVTDLPALRAALERHEISHVVHLAGLQVPTCRADPILGAKVNVLGTLAVFEAVRQLGGQVRRLVYASSAAVFGPSGGYRPGPAPDDAPLLPDTHYGVFKCCNEANARVYYQDFGLSSTGLRPWTVYGVGRDIGMTSGPTKAIQAVALGRPYHISYGGWQDLQYADDVAKTFVRCLDVPYQGARSYNLRGHVGPMADFHEALCAAEPAARELVTYGGRGLSIHYDLDDSALQRDLGPMPRTPLAEGVRQTLNLFRRLHAEGRLDTADLDRPVGTPAAGDGP